MEGGFVDFSLPLVDDVHFFLLFGKRSLISVLIGCLLLLKGSHGQCAGFSCAGQPSPTAQHGPAQLRLLRPGLRDVRRRPQEEARAPAAGPGVPEPLGGAQPSAEDQL